jgi:hypothetical protein
MRLFRTNTRPLQVAFVYEVTPPVEWKRYNYDTDSEDLFESSYVWVSAVNVPYSGPETYAFPCDWKGEVLDWMELPMSRKGEYHPDWILNDAGYTVEECDPAYVGPLLRAASRVVLFFRVHVSVPLVRLAQKLVKQ